CVSTCLPPNLTYSLTPHGRTACATPAVFGPMRTPHAPTFAVVDGVYGAASAVYHAPVPSGMSLAFFVLWLTASGFTRATRATPASAAARRPTVDVNEPPRGHRS